MNTLKNISFTNKKLDCIHNVRNVQIDDIIVINCRIVHEQNDSDTFFSEYSKTYTSCWLIKEDPYGFIHGVPIVNPLNETMISKNITWGRMQNVYDVATEILLSYNKQNHQILSIDILRNNSFSFEGKRIDLL